MADYDDYLKFKMNKPESKREYRTFEIYHPKFTQVFRFVQDFDLYQATLESGAPRNAGELVTFEPFAGEIIEPQERNDGDRALQIRIGDLLGIIQDELYRLDGVDWFTEIEVIYRKYWSDNNSEPAVPPLYVFTSGVDFEESGGEIPVSAAINASDTDLSKKSAGIRYTIDKFRGLA